MFDYIVLVAAVIFLFVCIALRDAFPPDCLLFYYFFVSLTAIGMTFGFWALNDQMVDYTPPKENSAREASETVPRLETEFKKREFVPIEEKVSQATEKNKEQNRNAVERFKEIQ